MINREAPQLSQRQAPSSAAAHVMMLPWPAQGHLNPMMHLAQMLSERGVAVTFVNTDVIQQRLHEVQSNYKDFNSNAESAAASNINFVSFDDGLTYSDHLADDIIPKQSKALRGAVPKMVQLGRHMWPRVTHVVGDMYFAPTSEVAQQLGVPHICFWTQSAASYAIHVHFTQNYAQLKDYFATEKCHEGRPIDFIPGCPPLNINDISSFLLVCDPSDYIFSNMIKAFTTKTTSYSRILFNTFQKLEPEALSFVTDNIAGTTPDKFCTIGPILPPSFLSNQLRDVSEIGNRETSLLTEDHSCIHWLDKQKPKSVLYVSFGSIAFLSREQIAEFAAGLEASGYLVLMVVRPRLMFGQEAVFPRSFSQGMSGGHKLGMCVAWAPQLQVLAHPAVGGFLTHAGWNSTLDSVSKGVPMLCCPYFSDQMLDTRFVVDVWKTGLDLRVDPSSGLVLRSEIEHKVKCIMDPEASKVIRENAYQLQQLAIEAYHNQSQANLESLVQYIFE